MKENNKISKLDSVKLVYNEKSKRIVANLVTIVDGVKVNSRTIDNIEVIKVLIDALAKQSKLSIAELVDKGLINVDSRLLDSGVIILDNNKEYKKYVFNKDTGSFDNPRLTRMEKKELGLRVDDEVEEVTSEIIRGPIPTDEIRVVPRVEPKEGVFEDIKIETPEETTIVNVKEEEKRDEPVLEDGAAGVIVTPSETTEVTEEKTKGVKNLKVNKKALAVLGVAAVVLVGSIIAGINSKNQKNSSNTGSNQNSKTNVETLDDNQISTPVFSADGQVLYDPYANIADKIQQVNDLCVPFRICDFSNLVDDSDKNTIRIINEARNQAVNNQNKVIDVIDEYAKYVFEGRTMFNNGVVKGYDYLTPFAKYVVLASGETLLQLCPDYNYSTVNNIYTYDTLVNAFDELINDVCNDMNYGGKTI